MERIVIIPVGSVDPDIVNTISIALVETFRCMVERAMTMPLPTISYDSQRTQYHSSRVLNVIRTVRHKDFDCALGVADVDLFVAELNFVFGEADVSAGTAVISDARLLVHPQRFPDTPCCLDRSKIRRYSQREESNCLVKGVNFHAKNNTADRDASSACGKTI
ncbi:MAG TPA: hypothetical protein VEM40_06045 [Nitrospirota bacterium]|nr:hypothetical protein [Nitrospirota bacterium]